MTAGEHRLALPAGYQLGKYLFERILGAGGFGITYLAEDKSLGREVAIKELLPNDIATRVDGSTVVAKTKSEEENLAWARDRFLKEGRALAACEHPNVVHVYEMIEANGTAYMVTRYEEGRSFAEWLSEVGGAPTEKELRAILLPLLSGLEKVHKSGFLHRDLKPENIYITDDGRPLLLDFGSARQAVNDRTTSLTSIVTSGYAPFEQYHEDGKQGTWTDIYAMSAVMYRAIHGKKPPEATRRLKEDPCLQLAKVYAGKYSDAFLRAVDQGLAVEPSERPQTVAEWREALGIEAPEPAPVATAWWKLYLRKFKEASEPIIRQARAYPQYAGGGVAVVALASMWLLWKLIHPVPIPQPGPTTPAPAKPTPPIAVVTPIPKPDVTPPPYVAPAITPAPTARPVTLITPPPGATPELPYPWNVLAPGRTVPDQHVKPNPWDFSSTTPTPAPVVATPAPIIADTKLVGTWSLPYNNGVTFHWQQFPDGRYVTTNAVNDSFVDSGTLTTEGRTIHRTSDVTHQTVDVDYEFKSSTRLITNDPTDPTGTPKTWRRISSGTSSKQEKSSSNGHSHSSGGDSSDSGPHINIPSNIRHYIPKLPF